MWRWIGWPGWLPIFPTGENNLFGITGTVQTSHGACAKKQKLTNRRLYWLIPIFQKRHSALNWARLIQKVYHTDPLLCPKCNGSMRIISFIEDEETIK